MVAMARETKRAAVAMAMLAAVELSGAEDSRIRGARYSSKIAKRAREKSARNRPGSHTEDASRTL